MSNMVMVDNKEGMGAYIQNRDNEYDFDTNHITLSDIIIYGEHENPDCPQNGQGGFCHRFDKFGFLASQGTRAGKNFHIPTPSPLPPQKVKSIATMATNVVLNNITFKGFRASTAQ